MFVHVLDKIVHSATTHHAVLSPFLRQHPFHLIQIHPIAVDQKHNQLHILEDRRRWSPGHRFMPAMLIVAVRTRLSTASPSRMLRNGGYLALGSAKLCRAGTGQGPIMRIAGLMPTCLDIVELQHSLRPRSNTLRRYRRFQRHPPARRIPKTTTTRLPRRLRRVQVPLAVQSPLLLFVVSVVSRAASGGLRASVHIPASERTPQIISGFVANVGEEQDSAAFALLQSLPQVGIPLQLRTNQCIVHFYQVTYFSLIVPTQLRAKMSLNPAC